MKKMKIIIMIIIEIMIVNIIGKKLIRIMFHLMK